jgi:hypothetical protein
VSCWVWLQLQSSSDGVVSLQKRAKEESKGKKQLLFEVGLVVVEFSKTPIRNNPCINKQSYREKITP